MDKTRSEGTDLAAVLAVVRRRFLIIAFVTVALAAVAFLLAREQQERYEASAQVLLRPSSGGTASLEYGAPIPESSVDLEALALSGEVRGQALRRLREELGTGRAANALDSVEATAAEESDIIEISATHPDPRVASLAANTVASAIITTRKDASLERVDRASTALERQLRAARARGDGPSAQAEVAQLRTQLTSLRQTEAVIDGDAEVISRARRPSTPSEPQPQRSALIGGFIGLLLGLALAFAKEQMDRRVRTSDNLEEVFGLPVLASIPRSRALGGGRRGSERLPQGEAEAFQMLRANLRHLKEAEEPRSLVVTSTSPAEGKTTVALQLARADAMIGHRVLLIEADLRRPALGKVLGIDDRRGLGSYLVEREVDVADVIRKVPLSISADGQAPRASMDVIVAGDLPAHPAGAVNSPRMSQLIEWAHETYDLVVIDTSPAGSVADAVPLMAQVDAVVVVGRLGKLNARQATRLRGQLERVGAPTSGLVATFVPGSEDAYAYGY